MLAVMVVPNVLCGLVGIELMATHVFGNISERRNVLVIAGLMKLVIPGLWAAVKKCKLEVGIGESLSLVAGQPLHELPTVDEICFEFIDVLRPFFDILEISPLLYVVANVSHLSNPILLHFIDNVSLLVISSDELML